MFRHLQQFPVVFRIKLKLATILYRTVTIQQPTYNKIIVELFHFSDIPRTVRSQPAYIMKACVTKKSTGVYVTSIQLITIKGKLHITLWTVTLLECHNSRTNLGTVANSTCLDVQ